MTSPSMLRQHSSFDSQICEDVNTNNSKSPYPCYPGSYPYPRNCHENLVYVMPSDSNESSNGPGGEPVTKNAGSRWREDETEALVEIWRDKICQTRWWKQSKGVRVNKEMWEEIAHLLAEREVFRTPAQCQIRMKNLLQFYRQTVDSRRSEKSWEDLPEYFDIVDRIMTRKETSIGGIGSNPSNETKNYSPISPDLSPPKLATNGEKVYEDEKENTKHSSSSDEKKTNKRKSMCNSDGYNVESEIDHAQHYPSTSNFTNYQTSMSRKVSSYGMKNEYIANSHAPNLPLYPTFSRHHNLGEPCNNNCCNKGPCAKKQCKEKEYNKELPRNDSIPPPPTMHAPPPEQFNLLPPPMAGNLPNESIHKEESRNHTCNYYGVPPPQQQPPQHFRHNYMQPYRGVPAMEGLKGMQPHLMFNQDLLQLQYKQMRTLIEIEKKRLEIEENRLKEEKEANNRTSAFLLEAVKILAETFRRDNNNNDNTNGEKCPTSPDEKHV